MHLTGVPLRYKASRKQTKDPSAAPGECSGAEYFLQSPCILTSPLSVSGQAQLFLVPWNTQTPSVDSSLTQERGKRGWTETAEAAAIMRQILYIFEVY